MRLHVPVEEPALGDLVRDVLAERRGVEVGALLDLDELRDDDLGRDDPRDPEARRERLRERREVEDVAGEGALAVRAAVRLGVELHERREVLALVPELAVGVVLDDRDPEARPRARRGAGGAPGSS